LIKNVRHSGIVVKDIEASLHFYRDLLGLKVSKRMNEQGEYIDRVLGLKDVKITTVKLAADDGGMIELLYFGPHQGKSQNLGIYQEGLTHIALTVDDLDSEYKRLSDAGIVFISPPQLSPDGSAKVAFCRDPQGVFVELVEVV
jgi:catechol 2,3-dioxygenase-like lactoylglutathione lyase family enzyme